MVRQSDEKGDRVECEYNREHVAGAHEEGDGGVGPSDRSRAGQELGLTSSPRIVPAAMIVASA